MTCKSGVGEFARRWGARVTITAVGQEISGGHDHPRRRDHQGGTAQMIQQEVEQAVVARFRVTGNAGGNRLPRQVVGTALDGGRRHP